MTNDFVLFPDPADADPRIDADVALITAYLGRELTLVQIMAVEERLATDTAFRESVRPIIETWVAPGSWRPRTTPSGSSRTAATSSLTAAEIESGWQRHLTGTVSPSALPFPSGHREQAGSVRLQPSRRHTLDPRRLFTTRVGRRAALIALIVLPGLAIAQLLAYTRHRATTAIASAPLSDHAQSVTLSGPLIRSTGSAADSQAAMLQRDTAVGERRDSAASRASTPVAPASANVAKARAPRGDLTMAMRTVTDSEGHTKGSVERFLFSGTRLRMEISAERAGEPPGEVMILNARDSTMISLLPALHTAMIIPMPSGMVDPDDEVVKITSVGAHRVDDLGAGGNFFGYDTHHYRVAREGTLTTTSNGVSCPATIHTVEDIWTIGDPALNAVLRSMEGTMGRSMGMPRRAGRSWSDYYDAAAGIRIPGHAVRTIRISIGPDGTPLPRRVIMEDSELSTAPLDSALFTVPGGYNVQDMRAMPGMADIMKSASDSAGAPPHHC